jgi:hypothetical protein
MSMSGSLRQSTTEPCPVGRQPGRPAVSAQGRSSCR